MKRLYDMIGQITLPAFKTIGSWMMIGGMPNVGKSTVINALRAKNISDGELSKKHVVWTAASPCVTRGMNGFKISLDPLIYLIDTPGIAYKRIYDNEEGFKLALCGMIRDGIISQEVLFDYALYCLNRCK